MKKIVLILSAFVLLAGCKEKKKPGDVTITSEDGKESVTINTNDMAKASEAMQNKSEELQKLTPLTTEQLKGLVPEQLVGAKRSNYEAQSAMGYSTVHADYEINDSTKMNLQIIDCAGPAGAGIYSLQYLGLYTVEKDSDEEYTKTIDFRDGKAFENCKKQRKECTLTFFASGRLLVVMEGENLDIAAIKSAANQLALKVN